MVESTIPILQRLRNEIEQRDTDRHYFHDAITSDDHCSHTIAAGQIQETSSHTARYSSSSSPSRRETISSVSRFIASSSAP